MGGLNGPRFFEETLTAFPDFTVKDAAPVNIGTDGRFGLEWTMSGTHKGSAERSNGSPTTGTSPNC